MLLQSHCVVLLQADPVRLLKLAVFSARASWTCFVKCMPVVLIAQALRNYRQLTACVMYAELQHSRRLLALILCPIIKVVVTLAPPFGYCWCGTFWLCAFAHSKSS